MLPARAERIFELLRRAGEVATDCMGGDLDVRWKADESPVTRADLAAEAILLAGIRSGWPEDAIFSEEAGKIAGGPARWVVDPIDGTSSFTEGLAHWGPTLARYVGDELDCGALWLPRVAEHFHVEGGRAWWNGTPLGPPLRRERVVYLPSRFHRYFQLRYEGKCRCLGGTAAHLALVARGAAEAAIVAPGWSSWDTAAGLGLIAVTGGLAVRLPDGAPLDPSRDEGVAFLAGDPDVVAELARPGRIAPLPFGATDESGP